MFGFALFDDHDDPFDTVGPERIRQLKSLMHRIISPPLPAPSSLLRQCASDDHAATSFPHVSSDAASTDTSMECITLPRSSSCGDRIVGWDCPNPRGGRVAARAQLTSNDLRFAWQDRAIQSLSSAVFVNFVEEFDNSVFADSFSGIGSDTAAIRDLSAACQRRLDAEGIPRTLVRPRSAAVIEKSDAKRHEQAILDRGENACRFYDIADFAAPTARLRLKRLLTRPWAALDTLRPLILNRVWTLSTAYCLEHRR